MTGPDERSLDGWFRIEMAQVQQSLVAAPVALTDLLRAKAPQARTRGGEVHAFDADALRRFAQPLSALGRALVRLPILFYLDRDAPGDCFVSDPGQAQALREHGLLKAEPRGD